MEQDKSIIKEIRIDDSMKDSYLDYSMSVIIGRALPNAKDGLKPVHRRILYAMNELNLSHRNPYKKSARIVGDVIGKYHPHGDTAVYDALVRMAQNFSMRLELIDGQGNFGSVDGDRAAAMRYTEARMTLASEEMLRDLQKETVEFNSNYDDTLKEPDILPTRFPNLLVNGAEGIAVGMATKIPPHRIDEVIDALLYMIGNKNVELNEILEFIKGPDFPTGGIIYGKNGILEAYKSGRGRIKIRAKHHIEKLGQKEAIIIDEIPYQVNKSRLIEQIDTLIKEKVIDGISEIRDESDRDGIRVVIELKRDAISEIVLNHLFKSSFMEITFGIMLLAINNKEPKIFTLLELLNIFIDHRKTIIIRRTIYDLKKANERLHILKGFLKALDCIDEIISLIRNSTDSEMAKNELILQFDFSTLQAKAILELRLQRLTGLEREKIKSEHDELIILAEELNLILKDEKKLNEVIKDELKEIKEKFNTPRKTIIEDDYDAIDIEDLIPNEPVVVTISHRGYVKRVILKTYEKQHRGGKGKIGANTYCDDFIKSFFIAETHDTIMFITNKGKLHWLKVYRIPEANRTAIGKAVVNLIDLEENEKIVASITTKDFNEDKSLVFFTKNGIVKRTKLDMYRNISKKGIIAILLKEDDELISANITHSLTKQLFIATKKGQCIRFGVEEITPTGRNTSGVIGIRIKSSDDRVISATTIESDEEKLLCISELGIGKKTIAGDYNTQHRGGKGVIGMKLTKKTGDLVSVLNANEDNLELMILSSSGKMIRIDIDSIRDTKRATSGVKLFELENKSNVISAVICKKEEIEEIEEELKEENNNE